MELRIKSQDTQIMDLKKEITFLNKDYKSQIKNLKKGITEERDVQTQRENLAKAETERKSMSEQLRLL